MSRSYHIIDSFSSGQISPKLRGRTDLAQYQNAVETLQNFILLPHGGITRRPGTKYVAEIKDSSQKARLFPFQFNAEQAYIIEMGDFYMRFYKDDGLIYSTTEFLNGDFATSASWVKIPKGATIGTPSTGTISYAGANASLASGAGVNYAAIYQPITLGTSQYTVTATTSNTLTWNVWKDTSTTEYRITNIVDGGASYAYAPYITINSAVSLGSNLLVYIEGIQSPKALVDGYYIADEVSFAGSGTYTLRGIVFTGMDAFIGDEATAVMRPAVLHSTGTINGTAQTFNITLDHASTVAIEFENRTASSTRTLDNVSISNPIYQIDTPYPVAELGNLNYVQSQDVMFFAHKSYAPRKLTRTGHAAWTFIPMNKTDGPYISEKDDGGGLSSLIIPSMPAFGTQGRTKITFGDFKGITTCTAEKALFAATDVGRFIRYIDDATDEDARYGYCKITGFTDDKHLDVAWIKVATGTGLSEDWQISAWSDILGWPAVVMFHDQRLYFAASTSRPQTFWGSAAGDFENFSPDNNENQGDVDPDTSVSFTIANREANSIKWMESRQNLFLGTSGSIFIAKGSEKEAIAPDSISVKPAAATNSSAVAPVSFQNATLFVQRYGKKLMELAYFFEEDSWRTSDITLLARDIADAGIVQLAKQEAPNNVLWCRLADGNIIALTYLRQEKVVGWHVHDLGGTTFVEDIINIEGTDQDDIYMIVKRTINGATQRYIERISPEFSGDKEDAWFLDCAIEYTGAAATHLTGLDHLEGETVSVVADGILLPDVTVTSGAVTLSTAVTHAILGYNYESIVQTFGIALPDQSPARGRFQSTPVRPVTSTVRFYETASGKFGSDSTDLETLEFRNGDDDMDDSPSLYSGNKTIAFERGWDEEIKVYIKQDQPLPMSVLSISIQMDFQEK